MLANSYVSHFIKLMGHIKVYKPVTQYIIPCHIRVLLSLGETRCHPTPLRKPTERHKEGCICMLANSYVFTLLN